jgi:mycothiol synthase
MPPIIAPLDPDAATEADLDDLHALILATNPVDMPEEPLPTREAAAGRLTQAVAPLAVNAYWGARVDVHLVGWAKLALLSGVNAGLAHVDVKVRPDHRRQGVGAELLRAAAAHASGHGRGILVGMPVKPDSAGAHWARRLGFRNTRHVVIQRLELRGDAAGKEWDAPVAPGYRLVQWSAAAPEELVASYVIARQAIADAPSGSGSYRDDQQWTPESTREQEREQVAGGIDSRVVVVIDEADGTVAGLTNVLRRGHNPELGIQMETSVLSAHRGHGLGLALKGTMVRTLLEAWPGLERIHTSNAADNEHMLAVNRALGYRPLREMIHIEIETAALIDNLARLP